MKKSVLEIYALSVCFATMVCFVMSLGVLIYGVVRIANPELTMNPYEYNRHQDNNAYWKSVYKYNNAAQRPSDEELTKQRLSSYERSIKFELHNALQILTQHVIILIIAVIIFLLHWRLARRARETNIAT